MKFFSIIAGGVTLFKGILLGGLFLSAKSFGEAALFFGIAAIAGWALWEILFPESPEGKTEAVGNAPAAFLLAQQSAFSKQLSAKGKTRQTLFSLPR
jgi:hypothetical protein